MNYMHIMVLYKNTLGSVKLLIADIYIERSPGILVLYNCLSNNSALIKPFKDSRALYRYWGGNLK